MTDEERRAAVVALARNLPLTLTNYPAGPHSFDLLDDSDASRAHIRGILGFLAGHLLR